MSARKADLTADTHGGDTAISILVAAGANALIAISKFAAFAVTGSSAMLTEAFHSVVDTGDQGLLLLGRHLSRKPPDALHPFGYGMEQYFWSFVVAILIFALGGAASIYEGVLKVIDPDPIRMPIVNFSVIAGAIVFEGISLGIAVRNYWRRTNQLPGLSGLRRSKDPPLFTVLLEDAAAVLGLLIAGAGVMASSLFGWLEADGYASIGIGALLILVAVFLAKETRSLLIGEAAAPEIEQRILKAAATDADLIDRIETLHLGPDRILVALTINSDRIRAAAGPLDAAARLARQVRTADRRIAYVYLEPPAPG